MTVGKNLEGSARGMIKVLSGSLSNGTEKNHCNANFS